MKRLLPFAVAALAACALPDAGFPPRVVLYGGQRHLSAAAMNPVQIVVLARDGAPAGSAVVHLRLDTAAIAAGMRLAPTAADTGFDTLTVTSNASGVATLAIGIGTRAGRYVVYSTATQAGVDDSIVMEFAAVTATNFDVSPITPLYLGDSALVTWRSRDASQQVAFSNATLDVANPATAAFVHGDIVKALAYGETWVRGQSGGPADSVPLMVLPRGVMGALVNGAWREFPLNGAGGVNTLALPGITTPNGVYSASGDTLAVNNGQHFALRLPGGSLVTPVTGALGFVSSINPTWSADGLWLYFTGIYSDGRHETWRIHPNGTGAVRAGPVAAAGERDDFPSVNASGTRLAFITNRTLAGGQPTIRVIDIGTGGTLWSGPAASSARYAPTAEQVAFVGPAPGILQVANFDGSGLRQLAASLTAVTGVPAWSRDGRWLAVSHGNGSTIPVYLHLADTQSPLVLRLPYAFTYVSPAWK